MHLDFSLPWQEPVLVFTLILLIILLVPVFLERIKIPSILGFIIVGIFIGKYGFNIISRNASIELFGTVGILYLMFIAGLEIDLNQLIKNKTKGIVFGIITIFIPVIISVPVFHFLFHYSLPASILIGGIFASHTLLTYPLISKLGISKNLAVNISIAGTLIADVTALLILAVITNNINNSFDVFYWIKFAVGIIIFGIVILWIIPKISRWFFKQISDNILQYIFVLSIVFLSALFAMLVGLEPIVGAFFAGLSLNRLIPYTSPLMNRIEFIGNALFIPFFLIGVGMLINYQVLFNSIYALIIIFVMTIISVVSKYWAAIITSKIFSLSRTQGLLIFGLSNARVAAALAIALIGFDLITGQTSEGKHIHLLDENIFNGVIFMILITSTISSFVTQNAGKKIAEKELKEKVFKDNLSTENILIGLANEANTEKLIDLAVSTINKKAKKQVYGLHIITKNNENNENINRAEKLITDAKKYTSSADIHLKSIIRYDMNIASGIINTIKERQITHFFMGLHEKASILDNFYGKLTSDLLKKSECTIYINKLFQPINTIEKFIVVIPPKAHLEKGFNTWLKSILQISLNTGKKLTLYASVDTNNFIKQKMKVDIDYKFELFDDFNDILIISKDIEMNTILIFNIARKHSISYEKTMEKIGSHIAKYFNNVNFMLVFPGDYSTNYNMQAHEIYQTESVVDYKSA